MNKKLILALAILISTTSIAYAQEPGEARGRAQVEAETRQTIRERLESARKNAEERRERLEDRRDEIETNIRERKERVLSADDEFKARSLARHYLLGIERLENIQDRLGSRLEKMAADGTAVDEARSLLSQSRAELAEARAIIEPIRENILAEEDRKERILIAREHRELLQEAREHLVTAKQLAVESLRSAKAQAEITTIKEAQ